MKKLITKITATLLMGTALLAVPSESLASAMTLRNNTPYIAQYVVTKGDIVIARLPALEPNAQLIVPTSDIYQVTASTIIEGNTYITSPMTLDQAADLRAVLRQEHSGAYTFGLEHSPQSQLNTISLNNSLVNPVQFTLIKNGQPLQSIVLNANETQKVSIESVFNIYAVVKGVTTSPVITTNPNAVITATEDTSTMELGYFTLEVE
ncbi:hypothetical protein ACLSU7_17205 [Bdellovibrio sp. HCB185ZH]|uniref:hypothetical protein n=1 Tax=Bdellovibrio sp. HCB185ZH TaxID=3394235 RepID=UPI0039A523EE